MWENSAAITILLIEPLIPTCSPINIFDAVGMDKKWIFLAIPWQVTPHRFERHFRCQNAMEQYDRDTQRATGELGGCGFHVSGDEVERLGLGVLYHEPCASPNLMPAPTRELYKMALKELRFCPFCGGKALLTGSAHIKYQVRCLVCGAESHYGDDEARAVQNWNRRA